MQAPAPTRLVEGGIPTDATVAHVLVSNYADHLPLYRRAQIYARQGVNLDRSNLADRFGKAAFLLRPDQDRPALRLCPQRQALVRIGAAWRGLFLRAGPQGRVGDPACRRLSWHAPGRWLQDPGRAQRGEPGVLLDPRRCRFYELAQSGPGPIAMEALARIAALYQVEGEIRGRPAEERHAAR
ncbi:mobile element protein [Bosea sp. BIWAKO-01]|nr:mobile element protein [Bosea sp. BIWAKO-01]